jgi:predicted GIY-YIG superfamily endonuclease
MTKLTLDGFPVLPAVMREDGTGWKAWCDYCLTWHFHGLEPGHRAADCKSGSPYYPSGYIGVIDPEAALAAAAAVRGKRRRSVAPAAVYRAYDADRVLLYVGVSKNFGGRWLQHAREKSWWSEVKTQTIEWFEDEPSAYAAETEAIRDENPAYNIAGRVRNGEPG